MTEAVVRLDRTAIGVAVVTLDRPDVHNSFNTTLADQLLDCAEQLRADDSVVTVVVTGAGNKAFCAGADISEFGALRTPDEFHRFITHLSSAVEAFAALPQIVIAAVDGVAFGGGCELAMACDLRTVSTAARFGLPEIKLGLLPGLGGTQRAARMLPHSVALRMLVTGDPIDADAAHRFGFSERPVERGMALEDAIRLADRLSSGPREAIVAAKQLLRDGAALTLSAAIGLEQQVGRSLFGNDDAREGISAFLDKRPASFGRG